MRSERHVGFVDVGCGAVRSGALLAVQHLLDLQAVVAQMRSRSSSRISKTATAYYAP